MSAMKTAGSGTVTILIESPDETFQEQIRAALNETCFDAQIVSVEDYHDSLNLVINLEPDIFVVDMDSENIGIQIIKLVKFFNLSTNIIATGNNNIHSIDECLSNGVKGYVIKPVDNNSLIKTVSQTLENMRNGLPFSPVTTPLRAHIQGRR